MRPEPVLLKRRFSRAMVVMLTILSVLAVSSCLTDAEKKTQPEPEPIDDGSLDILFIGSSYFSVNDLPQLFTMFADSAEKKYYVSEHVRPGWYLEQHAINSYTDDLIKMRDWDYVVLQGVGVNAAYPEPDSPFTAGRPTYPLLPALVILENKIHGNCEDTKILYCLPWAFEDGMTWKGFEDETYEVMQQRIIDNTLGFAEQVDFVIAPVGVAWMTVLAEPDIGLHYLHMSDWNHPSEYGTYLTTCVIYSSVFGESAEEIEYYDGIDTELAEHFQKVASETVLGDLEKWKLTD